MAWGSATALTFVLESVFTDTKRTGAPATLYVALLRWTTGGTIDDTLGTEPSSTGNYARVALSNSSANWTVSGAVFTNDVEIRWPTATAQYSITGALNQIALYDAASAGTCWAFCELTTTITVTGSGDTPVIAAGDVDFTQLAV